MMDSSPSSLPRDPLTLPLPSSGALLPSPDMDMDMATHRDAVRPRSTTWSTLASLDSGNETDQDPSTAESSRFWPSLASSPSSFTTSERGGLTPSTSNESSFPCFTPNITDQRPAPSGSSASVVQPPESESASNPTSSRLLKGKGREVIGQPSPASSGSHASQARAASALCNPFITASLNSGGLEEVKPRPSVRQLRRGSTASNLSFADQRAPLPVEARSEDTVLGAIRQRARSMSHLHLTGNRQLMLASEMFGSPSLPSSRTPSRASSIFRSRQSRLQQTTTSDADLESGMSSDTRDSSRARWRPRLSKRILSSSSARPASVPDLAHAQFSHSSTGSNGDQVTFPQTLQPSSPLATAEPMNADFEAQLEGIDHSLSRLPNHRDISRTRAFRTMSAPLFHPLKDIDIVKRRSLMTGPVVVDFFDLMLPRELRLEVFRALSHLFDDELENVMPDSPWSGHARGLREVIKCSRVCKGWRSLAFDGQLWAKLDMADLIVGGPGGGGMSDVGLVKLMKYAGPFVKQLSLRAMGRALPPMSLLRIADEAGRLCDSVAQTRFQILDLSGCRSITTQSLHYLLIRSPHLTKLLMRGLHCVTDNACDLLDRSQAPLVELDVRGCHNISATGLVPVLLRCGSTLRRLKLGRVREFDDTTMEFMGQHVVDLEVLDISGNENLTDQGMRLFSARPGFNQSVIHPLSIEDRRRMPLTHLNVSSCLKLTDSGFEALAHCVPNLKCLEASNIGSDLFDSGFIELFSTTPKIQKIDLEDACEITDRLIQALTPNRTRHSLHRSLKLRRREDKEEVEVETGDELEHLIISYATHVSDSAMINLIKYCCKLRILEADNTRLSDSTVKTFVRLTLQRKISGAAIGVVDSRSVGRNVVIELEDVTRPRRGRLDWSLKHLEYSKELSAGMGQFVDELDDQRVIIRSFWSWSRLDHFQKMQRKLQQQHHHPQIDFSSRSTIDGATRVIENRVGQFFNSLSLTRTSSSQRGQSPGCVIM